MGDSRGLSFEQVRIPSAKFWWKWLCSFLEKTSTFLYRIRKYVFAF